MGRPRYLARCCRRDARTRSSFALHEAPGLRPLVEIEPEEVIELRDHHASQ
jgi:hypothetical protein